MPLDGQISHYAKPSQPDRVDPFSLEGLIRWLEGQNPERRYRYSSCLCLLDHRLISMGIRKFESRAKIWESRFNGGIDSTIAYPTPHTFGAALLRARALWDQGVR